MPTESLPSPTPRPQRNTDLLYVFIVLTFQKFHVSDSYKCFLCLTPFTSEVHPPVPCTYQQSVAFYCRAALHVWMYRPHLRIPSPGRGYLDCVQSGAVLHNAALDVHRSSCGRQFAFLLSSLYLQGVRAAVNCAQLKRRVRAGV